MPEQQQKVKHLKKGKRKTPAEIEAEYECATVQFVRSFVRREPEKARKIFREMLEA